MEEGVFGWVTVNFLLDQLHNPRRSYVALDLGGGSTQITDLRLNSGGLPSQCDVG